MTRTPWACLLTAISFVAWRICAFLLALRRVRRAGLPYRIVPIHSFNLLADIFRPLWLAVLLHVLPSRWRGDWFALIRDKKLWAQGYNLFRHVGHDSFLTLTWWGDTELYTADADVVSQVMTRRADFPKTLRIYALVDIYGKSIISTEGPEFRRHSRIVGPPFSEPNNGLVWSEAVRQAEELLRDIDQQPDTDGIVEDLAERVDFLAIAVISKAGYGVRINRYSIYQDGFDTNADEEISQGTFQEAWVRGKTCGHDMSFGDTLHNLSKNLIWICIFPAWLLKILPLRSAQLALRAHLNWSRYIQELLEARRKQLLAASSKTSPDLPHDLLTSLARSVSSPTSFNSQVPNPQNSNALLKGRENRQDGKDERQLSDTEVFGNAFIFLVAGHESSAGALHHALLMLASHPDIQRQLQRELDEIFGQRPPSQWSYRSDFPKLASGLAGAVLSECLRLVQPVMALPKYCPAAQTIIVEGRERTIPAGTEFQIDIPAIHRNPNVWPSLAQADPGALRFCGVDAADDGTDLSEFKPGRWLTKSNNGGRESRDEDCFSKRDAWRSEPCKKGGYLPFSAGVRACIGQRFAQVEILAALARILRYHSIELVMPLPNNEAIHIDDPSGKRSQREGLAKQRAWRQAREHVEHAFTHELSLKLTWKLTQPVAVRFPKRGN